jgi:tRNA-dihydrouridine synthase B
MKIGNINIENNVFLAPMAGVTDLPFRLLCKEQGCGLTYTEMVSTKGLYYGSFKTDMLMEISPKEKPCAIQVFGSDPEIIGSMIKEISSRQGVDLIDINMGCPTPKIVKNGDGSALMLKPDLVKRIVNKAVENSRVAVTVKMRKGWDDEHVNAPQIAKICESEGAKAVTIHGRTREQFYSGRADWNIIKEVKQSVNIPVIGNGDITSPEDAKEMFEKTGCDGVMIGRGAQGNPWIFKRVISYLQEGILLPEPDIQERVDMAIKHLQMTIEHKGEYVGLREMRKHLGWYIKGIENSARIRNTVNTIDNKDEVITLLNSLKDL